MTRLHLASLAFAFALPCADLAASPTDTVEKFHNTLSENMAQSAKLHCEGRIGRLTPVVDATYDLPFIAEKALRKHWKALDDSQRKAFLETMRTSVISTYATEFAKPGAVSFTTIGSEILPSGDALVHTTLKPGVGGPPVSLDYVLKARGSDYKVVNVLAEGVSDLALRASQYDSLMKAEGFAALMTKLDAQNQEMRSRCK